MKRVTIQDVADKAGVTKATVSYVLNGKKSISHETTERIQSAIRELGYVPNLSARTLSASHSGLIGVVIPQTEGARLMFQNPFYAQILGSIEFAARNSGYHVLISACDANEGYLKLAQQRNLDGIIVIGMYPDGFSRIKESGIPVVLIDSYCNDHHFHSVRIDDQYGSYLATCHLLESGCQDLVFVCGKLKENGVMHKRLDGFCQALEEWNIPFQKDMVLEGSIDYAYGQVAAKEIQARKKRPSGIVAAADVLAVGILKQLHDTGWSVPEDISIVGFDDLEITAWTSPGLTTVHQDIQTKGETAVQLLLEHIQNPKLPKQEKIIPLHLLERSSVKKP